MEMERYERMIVRVRNNMLGRGTCEYFRINRDNQWCLKRRLHNDIILENIERDELLDLLEEFEGEDIPIETIRNIDSIKRELIYND